MDLPGVMRRLGVERSTGLSGSEAARRLIEGGSNELLFTAPKSAWRIVWEQLAALMTVILILAAAISALLGDYLDAVAIGAIVFLNALLGFVQEYRAERAIQSLRKLTVPAVRVRRDALLDEIPSTQLVPGDLLLLETGNLIAADCRIVQSVNLQTQESALTGESLPVPKTSERLAEPATPLADRRNMVYRGTFVVAGRGEAVVTEIGMRTEIGRIAGLIHQVADERAPLQRRLGELAKGLAAAAFLLVGLIFLLGLVRGENLKLMFLTAVSIAVAAVPEGLPAVVTIALTLGAQRMLKRRALIRKLSAVETLGSVTVICSDKTGTLTENQMTVTVLSLTGRKYEISRSDPGLDPHEVRNSGVALLLAGAVLCNDAILQPAESPGSATLLGDPTETALLLAGARFGVEKSKLENLLPRVAELPFSSERKRMTTLHSVPTDRDRLPPDIRQLVGGSLPSGIAFMKGTVENLIACCETVWTDGRIEGMDEARAAHLLEANSQLAAHGTRVLGVAFRVLSGLPRELQPDESETHFTFLGMIGMMDPPKCEVPSAVATCWAAGIRPVMITGDHPLTARYIATRIGITADAPILTGPQLDHTSSTELQSRSENVSVYARVTPEHKLRIVESLQRQGQIVAMTGDGVNDAPALKKADIGVAMGLSGTDVAKEAADMILLDDNFATIVAAVEEGRVIYDNILKFIKYLLATNSGEIWVMLVTPLFGMPLALLPLQILWMNLVTDGLPALALGVEPPESDIMRRPPHPPNESIFARGLGRHVLWVGILMGCLSIAVGYWYWRSHETTWQTMLFTTLTLSQMAHVLAIRSERVSLFRIGLFSNKPLLAAVSLTVLLQLALIYVPALQTVFRTVSLSASDLALVLAVAVAVFGAVELEKWIFRRPDEALQRLPV
jgi:Ca2+-transporting ATPase